MGDCSSVVLHTQYSVASGFVYISRWSDILTCHRMAGLEYKWKVDPPPLHDAEREWVDNSMSIL